MKIVRLISLIAFLGLCLGCFAACSRGEADKSSSLKKSSKAASAQETVSDESDLSSSDEVSDVNNQSGVSANGSTANNQTSSKSAAASEVKVTGSTKFGVTNTKKMPNYISKITNNTIKVLSSAPRNAKLDAETSAAFKALTGKELKFSTTVVTWDAMPGRLQAMVLADEAPDLFSMDISMAPFLVNKNLFEDIEKYIDYNDALFKEAKNPTLEPYLKYKGVRYGHIDNVSCNVGGLIYNTNLTKNVTNTNKNLKDPYEMFKAGTWDWNAFYKFVEEITVVGRNNTTEVYGLSSSGDRFLQTISSTGIDIVKIGSDGKLSSNLDNSNVLKAYNFGKKVGKVSEDPVNWEWIPRFVAGKIGFVADHLYNTNQADLLKMKKRGEIKWVPWPKDPDSKTHYVMGYGDVTYIPRGAGNPELTAAFLYYNRYSHYNPNANIEKKNKDVLKSEYGWTDEEYSLIHKQEIKTLTTAVPFIGNRVPDFNIMAFAGHIFDNEFTSAQVIGDVKPGMEAALKKINDAAAK